MMLESILGGLLGPVKDIALAVMGRELIGKVLTVWYWPALVLLGLIVLGGATWAHRSDGNNFSLKSLQGVIVSVAAGLAIVVGLTVTAITAVRGTPARQDYPQQHYTQPTGKQPSQVQRPGKADPYQFNTSTP